MHSALICFRLGFLSDEKDTTERVFVPICSYNDEHGVQINDYNEGNCSSKYFQPTFNEYGMCFTFNNRKQGMDDFYVGNSELDTHAERPTFNRKENKPAPLEKDGNDTNNILRVTNLVLSLNILN